MSYHKLAVFVGQADNFVFRFDLVLLTRTDQRWRQDAVSLVVVQDLSHTGRVCEQPVQFVGPEFSKRIIRRYEVRIVHTIAELVWRPILRKSAQYQVHRLRVQAELSKMYFKFKLISAFDQYICRSEFVL